jgi:ribosomal protein S18 acetylase RimI-like enzyme
MFQKDEWLSEQITKSVYQLKANNLLENEFLQDWKKFRRDHIEENYFVFSKISTNSVNLWQCLEKVHFKLIDTNVKFELHGNVLSKMNQQKNIEICFAEIKHQQVAGKIARDNFIYSRFHLDPLIDNDIASQVKQNWVKNYFSGKRGDEMVLALLNDKPVGFLQLIIKDMDLFIDLIGVDKKAQGKGLASAMINYAEKNIIHTCIKVGTQIGNLPSIKLYQKLGFVLTGSDYVFHYHSN